MIHYLYLLNLTRKAIPQAESVGAWAYIYDNLEGYRPIAHNV